MFADKTGKLNFAPPIRVDITRVDKVLSFHQPERWVSG